MSVDTNKDAGASKAGSSLVRIAINLIYWVGGLSGILLSGFCAYILIITVIIFPGFALIGAVTGPYIFHKALDFSKSSSDSELQISS